MSTLYMKTGCLYCIKVESALKELGLAYEEKYISSGDVTIIELIARGGKKQVPYFVDGDIEMYESDDIVAYLKKAYSKTT